MRLRSIRLTADGKINPDTDRDLVVVGFTLTGGSAASSAIIYSDNAATSGKEVITLKALTNDMTTVMLPSGKSYYLVNGGYADLTGSSAELVVWIA